MQGRQPSNPRDMAQRAAFWDVGTKQSVRLSRSRATSHMAAPFRAMIRPQQLNDGVATLKGHGKYHWYLVGCFGMLLLGGYWKPFRAKVTNWIQGRVVPLAPFFYQEANCKSVPLFGPRPCFLFRPWILFFAQKAKGGGEVWCEPKNPTSPKAKVGGSLAQIVPGLPADGGAGCDRRGGSLSSAARRDGKPETDSANRRAGKTSSQLVLCPVQPNYIPVTLILFREMESRGFNSFSFWHRFARAALQVLNGARRFPRR